MKHSVRCLLLCLGWLMTFGCATSQQRPSTTPAATALPTLPPVLTTSTPAATSEATAITATAAATQAATSPAAAETEIVLAATTTATSMPITAAETETATQPGEASASEVAAVETASVTEAAGEPTEPTIVEPGTSEPEAEATEPPAVPAGETSTPNAPAEATGTEEPILLPAETSTAQVTAVASTAAASAEGTTLATAAPPVNFELGGQIFTFLRANEMHSAGMSWVKVQIQWNRGVGANDARNAINYAHQRRFKVLLTITGVPAEFAARPEPYYQNFATFLGQVAAMGPDAIEVWNEPNIDRRWPAGLISGTNYAQMLAQAYAAIKQANPNVTVISGAPAPTGFFGGQCTDNGCDDYLFLQQMADAGASANMDCLGAHYNEGVLPPTATSGDPRASSGHYTHYFPAMLSTYSSLFPGKPICFTALGYLSPEGIGPLPPGYEWATNTSIQDQAAWLAQAATLARDSGLVRLLIVYNIDAPDYSSEPRSGWAIIRDGQCVACAMLNVIFPAT